MKKRLLEEWERYRRQVIPANAGRVQVEETRRAFYGGAGNMFALLTNSVSEGDSEPSAADLALLEGLQAELLAFQDEMMRLARS